MIPFCNGFYLFPLSRAVNSNSLIFDPSEVKIGLYIPYFLTKQFRPAYDISVLIVTYYAPSQFGTKSFDS